MNAVDSFECYFFFWFLIRFRILTCGGGERVERQKTKMVQVQVQVRNGNVRGRREMERAFMGT